MHFYQSIISYLQHRESLRQTRCHGLLHPNLVTEEYAYSWWIPVVRRPVSLEQQRQGPLMILLVLLTLRRNMESTSMWMRLGVVLRYSQKTSGRKRQASR